MTSPTIEDTLYLDISNDDQDSLPNSHSDEEYVIVESAKDSKPDAYVSKLYLSALDETGQDDDSSPELLADATQYADAQSLVEHYDANASAIASSNMTQTSFTNLLPITPAAHLRRQASVRNDETPQHQEAVGFGTPASLTSDSPAPSSTTKSRGLPRLPTSTPAHSTLDHHVSQAKNVIRGLREKLQYTRDEASADLEESFADASQQILPEEQGLASLLEDQHLLEDKLLAAKESQGDDAAELKKALLAALEASRQQNRELRQSLADANEALNIEIARRADAEKERQIAIDTMQTLHRSEPGSALTIDQALLERMRQHQEECENMQSKMSGKITGSMLSEVQPTSQILQIRSEIDKLQAARAAEYTARIQQLEEEIEEYEHVVAELSAQVRDANAERDQAKRDLQGAIKLQTEIRAEAFAKAAEQVRAARSPLPPTPTSPFGGLEAEELVKTALDQRDTALLRLMEAQDEIGQSRQTQEAYEAALDDQQLQLEQEREASEAKRLKQQDHMWRGWTSATHQMMKKMTNLEKELVETKAKVDKKPSLLEALDNDPTNPTIRSMTVLAAKDKERDTFVEATSKLHDFVIKVRSVANQSSALELRILAQQATDILTETEGLVNLQSLPDGWEAFETREGLTYFVDHINKRSTWIHPRLGTDHASLNQHHNDSLDTESIQEPLPSQQLPKRQSLLQRLKMGSKSKKSKYVEDDVQKACSSQQTGKYSNSSIQAKATGKSIKRDVSFSPSTMVAETDRLNTSVLD